MEQGKKERSEDSFTPEGKTGAFFFGGGALISIFC